MEIIKLKVDELTPDPNNAKDHPKWQIDQIKESIKQFGNLDPIGIWGDENLIVEGHGRWIALKQLGYKEVRAVCRAAYWEKDIAVAIALNSPLMTKKINDAFAEAWCKVASTTADMAEALRDKLNISLSVLSESMRNLAEQIKMSQDVP